MAQHVKNDWTLFWTIVFMVCFGLVMVYSSSSVMAELRYKDSLYFVKRQLLWAVLSFFVLMYCKRHDYRKLKDPKIAFAALGAVLAMLVAVYFFDSHQHRWFRTPIGSLQPSEFAKPALVIFLAYFLTRRAKGSVNNRHTLFQGSLAILVLALAVVFADLGTAIVLIATAGVVFFVAGLDAKYCAIAALALALFASVAIISKPYRLLRVVTRFDPDFIILDAIDPSGRIKRYMNTSETTRDAGYQARQSRIAVGSGGALGAGLGLGKQKWLYLPEAHTDFIYAVVGEELGLVGCTALLGGFLILMWRGLRLFWIAPDDFGRFLALGVTAMIGLQALINMSVVLDMGPTKGIPLPMISAGGSSLLSTLLCLGMLLSVSEQSS